jgi:hypothetical protein
MREKQLLRVDITSSFARVARILSFALPMTSRSGSA